MQKWLFDVSDMFAVWLYFSSFLNKTLIHKLLKSTKLVDLSSTYKLSQQVLFYALVCIKKNCRDGILCVGIHKIPSIQCSE